ncbi:unnamed protein product [Paramecium sonneborni]|uniref:Uncharacterized protein n=1 Tax=Paramecium sonneborni TaxID=65129 RepID=A0A8S1N7C6_9CILI|nr:unnamed protein product [Paramecium sonneborni]
MINRKIKQQNARKQLSENIQEYLRIIKQFNKYQISVMNIVTPETIKATKTISSNSNRFNLVTQKIDFNDPKPLLRFKTILANQISQK